MSGKVDLGPGATTVDDGPTLWDNDGSAGSGACPTIESVDLDALARHDQDRPAGVGTVAVVGMGHAGLPTALLMADAGASVLGTDLDVSRLASIGRLDVELARADRARLKLALASGRLALTASESALDQAGAVVICVPTPVDRYLVPDLEPVRRACATVVAHAHPGQLLVLTSTSCVGTTRDELVRPVQAAGMAVGPEVNIAFSPERTDPVVSHSRHVVPRVVGGATPTCTSRAASLFEAAGSRVHVVSGPEAAEMTRLIENTFRATNIALANEPSVAAGALGADMVEAIEADMVEAVEAATAEPYGYVPFYPGPGAGGHRVPCDPHYLSWQLRAARVGAPLPDEVMASIARHPRRVVERCVEVLAGLGVPLGTARVVVLGVAYKANVADVRGSPALEIFAGLGSHGAAVSYYDPLVPQVGLPDGRLLRSLTVGELAVLDAWDLTVVHTVHDGELRLPPGGMVLDATDELREPNERLCRL
jgi:nucleotide sugar dehydrogenase